MNTNLLRELRENRSLLQALLIGLFLIVFIWVVIVLFFRPEPEELVGPFPTATGPTAITSGTPQPTLMGIATQTGTVTPIVLSTFTPRTAGPPTATRTRPSLPTATGVVVSTPTVGPTRTPRSTPTQMPPPTSTDVPPTTPPTLPPSTPIIIPTIELPTIEIPTIEIPTIELPLP